MAKTKDAVENYHPREIRTSPLVLVGLVGANHLHQKLKEVLHERGIAAAQQKRANYLSLDYGFTLPPCKRGGQEKDGYVVEGILKRRWLEKVCNEIPALVTVCFDWSAELQPTPAEEAQAVSHLQHAREQIHSRQIKLLVFVVLHADVGDPESACGLVRQQSDIIGLVTARGEGDIAAKANRLESLIYQQSMTFYAEEEKRFRRPRMHAPTMSVAMSNALAVRLCIKTGYNCELRKDTRSALKSYIKAYEQLIHDTDIADVVERMSLCNHITLRMYQLYFHHTPRDVGLAVHHCRVHTATLRSCMASERDQVGQEALSWRRWYWLAHNHELFAGLLEEICHRVPQLIDQNDMWQFPSFHCQQAASYLRRLRHWATDALAPGGPGLPPASWKGGNLQPSPYLGQLDCIERPAETTDPVAEAAARCAFAEANSATTGDRCLQLIIRAHAGNKEREYKARSLVCTALMADEYLGEGNFSAANKLYEKARLPPTLDTAPQEFMKGPRPIWPALERLSLQRSISCSCRELSLKEPAICVEGCLPVVPLRKLEPSSIELIVDTDGESQPSREEAARQRLLHDAFALLALTPSGPSGQSTASAHELLEVAAQALKDVASNTEISFAAARAYISFDRSSRDECGITGLKVNLRNSLSVPIGVTSVVVASSCGNIDLQALVDDRPLTWHAGQDLELHGSLPQPSVDVEVSSVILTWASRPGAEGAHCRLVIKNIKMAPGQQGNTVLPQFRLPSLSGLLPETSRGKATVSANDDDIGSRIAAFQSKTFFPVDPATALIDERFIFHIVITREKESKVKDHAAPNRTLSLKCSARLDRSSEELGGDDTGNIQVALISKVPGTDRVSEWNQTKLLPDAQSEAELVAELPCPTEGGLRPVGEVLSLSVDALSGGPTVCNDAENVLVVPVMVSCDRQCKAILTFSFVMSGGAVARTVPGPRVTMSFQTPMQILLEDKAFPRVQTVGQGVGAIRKVTCSSLASPALELLNVTCEPGKQPALGSPGVMAPQSQHVFAIRPGTNSTSLKIQFSRADAVSAFFPWASTKPLLPDMPLPGATLERSLYLPEPPKQPAAMGVLKTELKHQATGNVAEPIEIRVLVKRTVQNMQELQVRVLQDSDDGGSADKFFLSGPMTAQVVLIASDSSEPQVCSTFFLVPLKPGWLQVPRVQVSAAHQESTNSPSSIFVFPSTQPILPRNVSA